MMTAAIRLARRSLISLPLVLAIAFARPTGPLRLPIASAQPPPATPSVAVGCTIEAPSAVADRVAVPVGGTVRLTLSWRWRCAAAEQTRDVLIVADPSRTPAGGQMMLYENLTLGYETLADRIGWQYGNRFGTVRAACPATVLLPLTQGEAAHTAWRESFAGLMPTQHRDLVGALDIARDALLASPSAAGAPRPVVVLVDMGIGGCASAPPPGTDELVAAAQAVRDAGAIVALVASRSSAGRLSHASDPGWYFPSSNLNGTDLPAIMGAIADRTVVPNVPKTAMTRIALATSDWDLVDPEPKTDIMFPEVQWLQPVARPDAGEIRVTAVLRARRDAVSGPRPLALDGSGGAFASLAGAEGDLTALAFDGPNVCVYTRGWAMKECGVREPVFVPLASRGP